MTLALVSVTSGTARRSSDWVSSSHELPELIAGSWTRRAWLESVLVDIRSVERCLGVDGEVAGRGEWSDMTSIGFAESMLMASPDYNAGCGRDGW